MAPKEEETRDVPIRTCETLVSPNVRTKSLQVFCPFQAKSFGVDACAGCPSLRQMPATRDEPGGVIVCAAPVEHGEQAAAVPEPTFAAWAAGVTVGAAMPSRVVCVRPELPFALAFAVERPTLLPVVDAEGRLVGVLWRPDVAPTALRAEIQLRARLGPPSPGIVAELLDTRHAALHESSPLIDALRLMTVDHARAVPVVADGGVVVGTLSDIDLLVWFGRAKRRR